MSETVDAVIVGAGHNGLVAANLLADAGWQVVVLDAAEEPGGATRSGEVTAPGFITDLFSAFYPMTVASPVMAALDLPAHGLEWTHAPTVLAHVRGGAPDIVMHRDAEATAAILEADHAGDGPAWLALQDAWVRYGRSTVDALLSPFPPVRASLRVAMRARTELLELVRMLTLNVRRLTEERFGGEGPGLLLGGNALHADLTPEAPLSAMLGWLLTGLGQTEGFPVPVGGPGRLSAALVDRLMKAGGEVHCSEPVHAIGVTGGRATSVSSAGMTLHARRAVIAACDAEILYRRLLPPEQLPTSFHKRFARFQRASGTVKVNWALDGLVPWADPAAIGAGTIHIADSMDELTQTAAELSMGVVPARPFLLAGQMTTADPTRSPAGTESFWAYTHVPQRILGDGAGEIQPAERLRGSDLDRFVERMQARIEKNAPGFEGRIIARHVQGPDDLEEADPSLIGGDLNGGTTQLHQQLVLRPVPGMGRAETPITGLYLGSASAHPGGSVHGACGANAARAAIWHDRWHRAGRRIRPGRP
jgi:phytoene dehydrogenase-like protein